MLELRRLKQAELLSQESEKNVAKYMPNYELAADTGDIVSSDGDATADKEQCNVTAVDSEQNTGIGDTAETEAGDLILSHKNVTAIDTPGTGRLQHLKQTEAEYPKPNTGDITTAGQSVFVKLPEESDAEILQTTDVKMSEVHDDDIDVIDLSKMASCCSSSRRVPTCFQVCLQVCLRYKIILPPAEPVLHLLSWWC